MWLDPTTLWYLGPLAAAIGIYLVLRGRSERKAIEIAAQAKEFGLDEPDSLHPMIDPVKCIGCGACVAACPEKDVLGIVRGKAVLVSPSECIGHGACRTACPVGAITLVFGTATRGVDLPNVGPDFQTNVTGLYIAGELGGMGLIRNAIEQGRQAMAEIVRRAPNGADYDVIIVGAGPSGLSAALAAQQAGLRYVVLEQDTLGGAIAHYPRAKLVMTQPAELPVVGRVKFGDVSKEDLLSFWTRVAEEHRLNIATSERVEQVARNPCGSFTVLTTAQQFNCGAVLLCIGRRGSPRQLNVPGEVSSKVVYRLVDPIQYEGLRVLVVGGGDSALEAAAALAEETSAEVTLVHRGAAFGRAKPRNRQRVSDLAAAGRIRIAFEAAVEEILPDRVTLQVGGKRYSAGNDAVIVCTGGILPTEFLRAAGVRIETKFGSA